MKPVEARPRPELVAALAEGHEVAWLHLWGHRPRPDGSVGKGCLSQWYDAPFEVDERRFVTAEHWMMWRKAVLFDDHETAALVLAAHGPAAVKALGRRVRGFDEQAWREARFDVVVEGGRHTSGSDPRLRDYLLGTAVLVEASPHDRIWGIGLGAADDAARDPERWRGQNLLGFALMELRHRLGR